MSSARYGDELNIGGNKSSLGGDKGNTVEISLGRRDR